MAGRNLCENNWKQGVCVIIFDSMGALHWEEIFGFHVGLTMKKPFLVQLRRPFIFLIAMI